jgi:hypothetical protein
MFADISDGHRGHVHDLRRVCDRDHHGNDRDPGLYPDPSGGHALPVLDPLPNSRQSTVLHHGAALPIGPLHMAARSNILRANGNACQRDTSNRRSTHTRGQDLKALRKLHAAEAAGRCEFRLRLARTTVVLREIMLQREPHTE